MVGRTCPTVLASGVNRALHAGFFALAVPRHDPRAAPRGDVVVRELLKPASLPRKHFSARSRPPESEKSKVNPSLLSGTAAATRSRVNVWHDWNRVTSSYRERWTCLISRVRSSMDTFQSATMCAIGISLYKMRCVMMSSPAPPSSALLAACV